MAEISFLASMPQVETLATRVSETGTITENKIEDIYVLVFDETSEELVYKGAARDLTPVGTYHESIGFKATLPVGKSYDFVILANAESLLTDISIGQTPAVTKSNVEALEVGFTSENSEDNKWKTVTAIPMWGDLNGLTLSSSSDVTFNLTRMLARISVEYAPSGSAADNFFMTAIRYYNYNTSGMVVPATNNMTGSGDERYATTPTLPTDPGTELGEYVEYTTITDGKVCNNLIYVFENENRGEYNDENDEWIDNPCLVVGGKYDSNGDGDFDDESVTWYRVDFIKKEENGDEWFSLLRNFSYNVMITSVSGDGYGDSDTALESVPMNMEVGVIDWNDAQIGDITADGPNWLSLGNSRNEEARKAASLYRNATSTDEIEFTTNIPLDKFTMELTYDENAEEEPVQEEPATEEAEAGMVSKIHNSFYEIAIIEGEIIDGVLHGKFVFTALNDYSALNPISTLVVSSGRIRYEIRISQKDSDPQDWNDGGNQDKEL
jgi:hypothetical protein